jgi:hypothetical protein
MLEWTARLDLRLINLGSSNTRVAWRVESIVDLMWANPAAADRVSEWMMSRDETLSDHHCLFLFYLGGGDPHRQPALSGERGLVVDSHRKKPLR